MPQVMRTRFALLSALSMLTPVSLFAKTNIDVLVVYTNEVSQWASTNKIGCTQLSDAARQNNERVFSMTGYQHPCVALPGFGARTDDHVQNLVDIALQEINDTYQNSGLVNLHFQLAGAIKIEDNGLTYDERFSASNIQHNSPFAYGIARGSGIPNQLYQLRNRLDKADANASLLNSVHTLRERYNADLVVMLVDGRAVEPENRTLTIDGLAMAIGVNNPRDGFTALKANIAITPYYGFVHEVSHLLGANHYNIRVIPGYGPADNNLEFPDFSQGQVDNWSFQNTVDNNGKPRFNMYSDVMTGVRDAFGNAIVTPTNAAGKKVVANIAWEADKDTNNTCIRTEIPDGTVSPLTITTIPSLSTLRTRFTKPLKMGNTAHIDETACLMVQSSYEDGTQDVRLVTLKDTDSTPRNARRIVSKYVTKVAQFSNQLSSIIDQQGPAVAIDFGPDMSTGPLFIYDDKTIDPACSHTPSGTCHWNNITQFDISTAPYPLLDQNGIDSAARLSITQAFHGASRLLPALSASIAYGRDESAVMANTDFFMATQGYPAPELTITGLDAQQSYVIRVFGTANAGNEFLVANYFLTSNNGRDKPVTTMKALGTHNNISRFVEYRQIRPLNGAVSLRVETSASVPMGASVGLSGITFFPE